MLRFLFFMSLYFFQQPLHATLHEEQEHFRTCLKENYKLGNESADLIVEKVFPLFTFYNKLSLLREFLILSKQIVLTPPSEQTMRALGAWDAVIKAPDTHEILFENDTLRILNSSIWPGDYVPFHTHQWDCIMIILQGSKFRIEDASGNNSEAEWGELVEKFEGSSTLESYTHIGTQGFRAISFELKK